MFTRKIVLLVNARSFSHQRGSGPGFFRQFGPNYFDCGSTSDERDVGGILSVNSPMKAAWQPQVRHGHAGGTLGEDLLRPAALVFCRHKTRLFGTFLGLIYGKEMEQTE